MRVLGTVFAALAVALATAPTAPAQAAAEPDGAALYRQHCRSCHGARGAAPERMRSVYPTLTSLADSAAQQRLTIDAIVGVLQQGKGKDMKPFGDRLSPAEMVAIAKFVRTFGSPAPAPAAPPGP